MSEVTERPEGLRKIARDAAYEAHEAGRYYHEIADAVLAALFEACEVRERWGVRWIWDDGDRTVGWYRNRTEAETERDLPHRAEDAELVHRCDIQTPIETIPADRPSPLA